MKKMDNTLGTVMNYIMYNLLVTVMLMINASPALAGNNSAAAYVRLGVDGRIMAMGNAGTAISRDINAAYWNTAGLFAIKDVEVATQYNLNMMFDRSYTYAAIGQRYDWGALALSWQNASVGDIEGYDDNGQPTGTFSNNEHSIALSYANHWKRFQFGTAAKFYLSMMDMDTENGFGLDLGIKYDINQYLVAGLNARDFYGKIGSDLIPYQLSVGVGAFPFLGITLAADVVSEKDVDPYFNFGAEYWTTIGKDVEADARLSVIRTEEKTTWQGLLANTSTGIRLGFHNGRFTAGSGLRFRNLQVDYAYRIKPNEAFTDEHIVSLIMRF